MKKFGVLLIFAFAAIIISPSLAFSAKYPSPTGYVNDFADIIPEDIEQRIEAKISEYEKKTSVEIAVVTTKSLNGLVIEEWTMGLATQWGVGKKGKDNGVVFVVAPNERKSRIEVGYGLEWQLNDAKAGRIMREHAIPQFKEGDYITGIEQTVNTIMHTLGTMSLEERQIAKAQWIKEEQERREREAAERRAQEARAKEQTKMIFLFILLLVVLAAVIYAAVKVVNVIRAQIREYLRKKELRGKIKGDLVHGLHGFQQLEKRLSSARQKAKDFPRWAFATAESSLNNAEHQLGVIEKDYDTIEELLAGDPDKAESKLNAVKLNVQRVQEFLAEAETEIPRKIRHYEEEAPLVLKSAKGLLLTTREELKKAQDKGFFRDDAILGKKLDEQEKLLLENHENLAKDVKSSREVYEATQDISQTITAVLNEVKRTTETKQEVEERLDSLQGLTQETEGNVPEYSKVLDNLKKNNPEENWKDIAENFLLVAGLIAASKELAKSAKEKNSMEQQEFYAANEDVVEAERQLGKVSRIFESIAERQGEIQEAKQGYESKLIEAQEDVRKAAEKVEESNDVGEIAKNKAKEAEEKMQEAEALTEKGGLVNWLILILLFTTAISLANEAIRQAEKDIDDAEEERRRKREEEEEERRSSYDSSDDSWSVGGSSSGGGGFGGFGGGGFGGGGATGSW